MIRYDRIGDGIETFDRAVKVLADALTMESEYTKESDNMREITGENTNESKRHYIADEELGGVEREYVETDRKADVGDYVYIHHCAETPEISGKIGKCLVNDEYDDGSIDVDIPSSIYGSYSFIDADYDDYYALSPTDIIRHNGERYRMVDRRAEVGDRVFHKDDGIITSVTASRNGLVEVEEYIDDEGDDVYGFGISSYHLIAPVTNEQETDAPTESQPDLEDLIIRLSRKVAELEKTANNADYKAGQALTTAELQAEKIEEELIFRKNIRGTFQ